MADFDLTDIVKRLEEAFVSFGTNFLFAWTVSLPYFSWLGLPVISTIYKAILRALVGALASTAEMQAFFWHTAVKKLSQAKDFVDAVDKVRDLPKDVSDADYEKAEKNQIINFTDFVRIT